MMMILIGILELHWLNWDSLERHKIIWSKFRMNCISKSIVIMLGYLNVIFIIKNLKKLGIYIWKWRLLMIHSDY